MECFIVGERYEAVELQYAGKKFSFEISRKRSISPKIQRYFPVKLDKCKPNFPSHILSTDADIMTFVSRGVRCDQRLLLAWHFIFFVVEPTTTAASTQPALLFSLERHDPVYNAATSSSSIPIRQSQIGIIKKKMQFHQKNQFSSNRETPSGTSKINFYRSLAVAQFAFAVSWLPSYLLFWYNARCTRTCRTSCVIISYAVGTSRIAECNRAKKRK